MKARRGIVLLIVLFLVLILAVVIFQFQASADIEKRIALTRIRLVRASYLARSKLALAHALILENPSLSPPSLSGKESIPPEEGGEAPPKGVPAGVTITDASAMLNVNALVGPGGRVDSAVKRVLENILTSLDADPAVADMIIDCIDPDSRGDYEGPASLNRPFQNITELGLVPGVPPEILTAKLPDGRPGLFALLTVFSDGRINVNTAPREILDAVMGEGADPKVLARILERRRKKPFTSLHEVYTETGARRAIFGDFAGRMTTRPSAYIVDVEASEGDVTVRARGVFRKQGRRLLLVFYREE